MLLPAFSPFTIIFPKHFLDRVVKSRDCVVNVLIGTMNGTSDSASTITSLLIGLASAI